ncbi:methylated-DNA--[protein]-cysteine S-methyltransferase [Inmirania thermothiophila]|uniref:Methylated-DNA-[protein]-cysteine S-methyltransferase n=1 Tax=Inmirania thermothiophila TaxID=1750597 RepID=A0A3N1XT74_9GAMM|nr:methylated-DNA--[protein]-cysteine S-methyltransferase [Inmirania thermothiophila]ROR29829.1 methylated-DNA-[protein]-cysteine S-methyltransferase [Inmirania thermothiophila]
MAAAGPFDAVMAAPFGRIGIRVDALGVREVVFLPEEVPPHAPRSPMAARAVDEIGRYLADPRHRPEVPWRVDGTPFRRRVWAALVAIPPGRAVTYGALARALGSAPRAVGQACRANPVPLLVPCHRAVAARGPGGFAGARGGAAVAVKRWLLAHEGVALAP